jgi:hypothetical protein
MHLIGRRSRECITICMPRAEYTDHFSELVPATAKKFEEMDNNFGRAQSRGSTRCPATVARGSIEIVVNAAISNYLSLRPDR